MDNDLISTLHKEYEEISIRLAKKGISTFVTITNESSNKGFSIVCGDLESVKLGLIKFMLKDPNVYKMISEAVNTAGSILASKSN